ncbi:MAG: lactate dehydrogenase-like 2-hydroxyacid dehydrogenase [Celeribacter sp.]|jgi:lactate dehydrogenase-like 2-hydroxyacid dehydrogenase
MTDTPLLILGAAFSDDERYRLETAHNTSFSASPDAVSQLPEAVRITVKAIAFKGHNPLNGNTMDLLPNLGVIANYGVGYDAINVVDASARGIKVTNTPDVLNDDVADIAVGMMIAQSRNMIVGDALVRSGKWAGGENLPLNRKMSGSSVGIVGLGRIGRDIADRLAAFKMDIHYHARSEKQTPNWTYHDDVVSLASAVDYLVIALVGGKETEKYVSAEAIAALGSRGVVINISRGSTIDEEALITALTDGTIAGAGLDVFNDEPKIDERFYGLPTAVLQPHQGSGTVETRRAMAELQLANVTAHLNGTDLLTAVN